MWRLASAIDDSTHLWIGGPPVRTYCGVTARAAMGRPGTLPCLGCVRIFGADAAARFPHLSWRRSSCGRVRHAFDPAARPTGRGSLWPVCRHYSFPPNRLCGDERAMRCPGCVHKLRLRTEPAVPIPA